MTKTYRIIGAREQIAVTAMKILADIGGKSPVKIEDIAKEIGISISYLEQIFARLRRNGLVISARGPHP